jgi:transposase
MEATSDYWKSPFYLLEAAGFETWLVNAKDVTHLPGRPKTDRLDAVWLCKVAERQMLRPSFVPPAPIRVLRDLTRYRWDQVAVRTAEKQRVEKLLEEAFTVHRPVRRPSRVLAGQNADPDRHGQRRHRRTRGEDQCRDRPFRRGGGPPREVPGIGHTAACVIIAEIGVDMTRFPTPGHLCSWARFAPGVKESAGRKKGNGATGHGNRYLARVLGEAAVVAGKTDSFLGERYRARGQRHESAALGRQHRPLLGSSALSLSATDVRLARSARYLGKSSHPGR